jgi:hypothetical protein
VNTAQAAGTAWGSGAITNAALATDAISASKLNDDVSTEIRDKIIAVTCARGTVGTDSTTATLVVSAITPATTDADQLKGSNIIFDANTTTAALRLQKAAIVSHTSGATPTFTLATGAWTTAPRSGDTFTVV